MINKKIACTVSTVLLASLISGCATVKIPNDAAGRDRFFMQEKHIIEAKCGWLGVIDVYTGLKPYVYLRDVGEFKDGSKPRMKDGNYLLNFNSDSLTFAYVPNSQHAAVLSADGTIPCSWNFIAQ